MKKIILLSIFLTSVLPVKSDFSDVQVKQKEYCIGWSYRFLSMKDGANFMSNKISAKKFPKYVDLCLENYDELRNYYQKLKKENHMKSIK